MNVFITWLRNIYRHLLRHVLIISSQVMMKTGPTHDLHMRGLTIDRSVLRFCSVDNVDYDSERDRNIVATLDCNSFTSDVINQT